MDNVIEPRNKLTKDVFINTNTLSEFGMSIDANGNLVDQSLPGAKQYEILNHYATIIAEEYLEFYGLRHNSYEMKLQTITWDMLSWDLTSIFTYNNKRFFITDLSFDFVESTCSITLVSIEGYSYNKSNILIAKNPETEVKKSVSKAYNNYGEQAVILSPYWDGSANGLNAALGRKSLELSADNAPEFGGIRLASRILTGNYSLTAKENAILCDCTNADITLVLPAAESNKNLEYLIQKTDSSTHKVTISGTVSGLTDHALLYQRETIRIKSDGTNWIFLSRPAIRTFAGSPVGQLVPQYTGEEVYNSADRQWFKATGTTNQDWTLITLRQGDDVIVQPGTTGKVLVMQPGTQKSDNKFLSIIHEGIDAVFQAATGIIKFLNNIAIVTTNYLPIQFTRTDNSTWGFNVNGANFKIADVTSNKYPLAIEGNTATDSFIGRQAGDWEVKGSLIAQGLIPDKIVETDANRKLTSVNKGSAYNKNFGTGSGDVAAGNHNHDAVYEPKNTNIQTHIANAAIHFKYTESDSAPSAVSGDFWYRPATGKVAIATIDGWKDLN